MRKPDLLLLKHTVIFFFFPLVCPLSIIEGQTVDSIYTEQTGDLIKIHYKILNSTPDQVFRVSLLCSLNGGLKSQLNSLSGDYGENVTGGRDNYMILWDVLKDVDELTSAEFFIKAELVKDISAGQPGSGSKSKIKGNFFLLPGIEMPGPKGGLRIGYMGGFGFSIQLNYGKVPVTDEYEESVYYKEFNPQKGIALDLTKRIVNVKNFQMHVMAGYRQTDLLVYYAGTPEPQFWRHGLDGLGAGTVFAVRHLAASFSVAYYNPDQVKKKISEPVVMASPKIFIDFNLGVKF